MTPTDDFDFGSGSGLSSPSVPTRGTSFEFSSSNPTFSDGYDEVPTGSFEAAGPPVLWMWSGVAVSVAGIVVALLFGATIPLAWLAWALCGPVAIGLFSVFMLRDTKQRAKPLYGDRVEITWIFRAGWALAFVGVIIAALHLAEWVGRW